MSVHHPTFTMCSRYRSRARLRDEYSSLSSFLYLLTIRGVGSLPVDRLRFPDVLFTLSYQQRVTHVTIVEVLQQHTLHTHTHKACTQGLAHTNIGKLSSIERMKNNLWLLTSSWLKKNELGAWRTLSNINFSSLHNIIASSTSFPPWILWLLSLKVLF